MDKNLKHIIEKKVERTITNLEKRNINGYYVSDEEALIKKLNELIPEKSQVGIGGSMTLFETGTIDYLRNANIDFLDRFDENLTGEERSKVFKKACLSDVFVASTNAITEKGELYNVDASGSRVGPMIFGPDKVIVITGVNKIVKDLDAAKERNEQIAAPANVVRIGLDNPCSNTGSCVHCMVPNRLCNIYTVIDRQFDPERMHVIFIDGDYGY